VERIRCSVEGGTAVVRMDDGKVNAIGSGWCAELGAALDRVEADGDATALLLFGRPGYFSAGLDRKLLPTFAPAELRATTQAFVATMERVFLFPKPVLAASAGHALAGGLMLYLASDLRLALDDVDSRYGLPEVSQGIPLIGPTAAICSSAIPPMRHTELLLHARRLNAREAFEWGLVHELAASQEALEVRALERARELRGLDLTAHRATKRALRAPLLEAARASAQGVLSDVAKGNPFSEPRRSP
jgi:enoyl-CoA hydratase/carnithine racemase